jgi:hypothetical protein
VRYCLPAVSNFFFKSRPHPADRWLTIPQPTLPTPQGYNQCLQCLRTVVSQLATVTLLLARAISSTLKMEEVSSFETSIYNKHTRRHIPEDGLLLLIIS